MTEQEGGKKPRKKLPRPHKTGRRPGASEALKKCWQDPEWVARRNAKHKRTDAERRKADPEYRKRTGTFDGIPREESQEIWKKARQMAEEDLHKFDLSGVLPSDEEMVKEALLTNLTIMRTPTRVQDKIAAARTILEYKLVKPVAKHQLALSAEDLLALVSQGPIPVAE